MAVLFFYRRELADDLVGHVWMFGVLALGDDTGVTW